jgi:hypothetical protein
MNGEDAGRPGSGNADELLRRLVGHVEDLVRRSSIARDPVTSQTAPDGATAKGDAAWLNGTSRLPLCMIRTVPPGAEFSDGAALSAVDFEEAAEIDRIMTHLEDGIARENEAIDALLSRLRKSGSAV